MGAVLGLRGERIVVSGATGQVGLPVALALAADNEVTAIARFSDPAARERLEAAGAACVPVNLRAGDLTGVPTDDVDAVLNFGVSKSGRWDIDLRITAEAAGDLVAWCRPRRFLHCSTTGVYRPKGHELITETDPLGDNHAVMLPTYSISKVAAEAVVSFAARQFGVPTTIARLSVPYGDNGGWPLFHLLLMQDGHPVPVHIDAPSVYRPIHEDDIIRQIPALLDAAALPPTIVNWGGDESVSIEEWCGYLGELTGLTPVFDATAYTLESVDVDTSKLVAIAGAPTVPWRDGMRRMVAAQRPELLA